METKEVVNKCCVKEDAMLIPVQQQPIYSVLSKIGIIMMRT